MLHQAHIFASLLIASCIVSAYPDYSGQCTDDQAGMAKGMGGKNTDLGWVLAANATNYTANAVYSLRLTNTKSKDAKFTGLLLYVRLVDGPAANAHVGRFLMLPEGINTLDEECKAFGMTASTLSHSSSDEKTGNVTYTWQAPKKDWGNVEIRGLIVGSDGKSSWQQFKSLSLANNGTVSDNDFAGGNSSSPQNGTAFMNANSQSFSLLTIIAGTILAAFCMV